jgi:Ca-activated chloride channel family protein
LRSVRVLLFALCLAGCESVAGLQGPPGPTTSGTGTGTGDPGFTGATVGGVKDIGQFRAEVSAGQVPLPNDFTAEGLLAEHDFPVEGGACNDRLCARPAIARHLLRSSGNQEIFVNVGMASNLGANWQRPPADLVVVLDKSASMSIDIADTTAGIALMIDRLRDDDRFGMIVFDDAPRTLVPLGPPGDRAALKAAITSVTASGGFEGIIDGVKNGFSALSAQQDPARTSRLMLFACSVPSAGEGPFGDVIRANADASRGTSFFGILVGQDQTSVQEYAALHGGNAFFLDTYDRIRTVFDADLDLIITPLAYDYAMQLQLAGATLTRVWGIPDGQQKLSAATLFPSRSHGAIVLQLSAAPDVDLSPLMSLSFSYKPALGQADVDGSSPTAAETNGGVHKAAAVVNMADGLTTLLTDYIGDHAKAKGELQDLRTWLSGEADALSDDQLHADVTLLDSLAANMK